MNPAKQSGKNGKVPATNDDGEVNDSRLEQVREILFGEQVRDVDDRFSRLEGKLADHLAELQSDLERRFDAARKENSANFKAVREAIDREGEARKQSDVDSSLSLERAVAELTKKIEDTDERASASLTALEQEMQAQVKSLGKEIRELAGDSRSALADTAGDLQSRKADREDLAVMFAEIADRLKGEQRTKG